MFKHYFNFTLIIINVDVSSILGANQNLGTGFNPGGVWESRPPDFGVGRVTEVGVARVVLGCHEMLLYCIMYRNLLKTRYKVSADFWKKSNHLCKNKVAGNG